MNASLRRLEGGSGTDALTANQEGQVRQICAYASSNNQFIPAPNSGSGPGSHRQWPAQRMKGARALTFEGQEATNGMRMRCSQ